MMFSSCEKRNGHENRIVTLPGYAGENRRRKKEAENMEEIIYSEINNK